jgi:hypothetical protein
MRHFRPHALQRETILFLQLRAPMDEASAGTGSTNQEALIAQRIQIDQPVRTRVGQAQNLGSGPINSPNLKGRFCPEQTLAKIGATTASRTKLPFADAATSILLARPCHGMTRGGAARFPRT